MYRCEATNPQGKRCVLAKEHQGKIACRFGPKEKPGELPPWKEWIAATRAFGGTREEYRRLKATAPAKPGTAKQAMRKARKALRLPELAELDIVVPLVPPSVNHYKMPLPGGRRGCYVTPEAKQFKAAVAALSRGSVRADWYEVTVTIYFGKDQRGDADNCLKVPLDALVDARIITTDSRVKPHAIPERDWDNPRTEIKIRRWEKTEKCKATSLKP